MSTEERDQEPKSTVDMDRPNLNGRVEDIKIKQQVMAVERAENETDEQKRQQKNELHDRRSKLLNAVRVEAPEIAAPLFEKMQDLANENHAFASQELVDLLKVQHAKLKDEPDFFDLGVAQREDLLDRIGYYRGVVIDHTLSNPVEPGFRDILMRPDLQTAEDANLPVKAADLLYRKPNFSGYFENYFTTSSDVHQTQKNGVTNLQVSMSGTGGKFVEVSGSAAVSSYSNEQLTSGHVGKMVYTTANFFLPKVELSFEHRIPCASKQFYDCCRAAVQFDRPPSERDTLGILFRALKRVLDDFGHFVPTQILVGGRIFATESKIYDGQEDGSDLTERFAVKVKATLSSAFVDAEAAAAHGKSTQSAGKSNASTETQSMTFHAVGGEGTVVRDAGVWAESLYDYRRWAVVQRENLIPSLEVLPRELGKMCWAVLDEYSASRSKRDLIYEDKAHFLFYGEYGTRAKARAGGAFFTIDNFASDCSISLTSISVPPVHGLDALAVSRDVNPSQLWKLTDEGQLLSYNTAAGALQQRLFALAVDVPDEGVGKTPQDEYEVNVHQIEDVARQFWDYPGSGELFNRALGKAYVLDINDTGSLRMRKRSAAGKYSRIWNFNEISLGKLHTVQRHPDDIFTITVNGLNAVLGVGGEGLENHVVFVNQLVENEKRQQWYLRDNGEIVSVASNMLLTIEDTGGSGVKIFVRRADPDARLIDKSHCQRWLIRADGRIAPLAGACSEKFVTASTKPLETKNLEVKMNEKIAPARDFSQIWNLKRINERQQSESLSSSGESFAILVRSPGNDSQPEFTRKPRPDFDGV